MGLHLVWLQEITIYFSLSLLCFSICDLFFIYVLAGYVEQLLASPIVCKATVATVSQKANKRSLETLYLKDPPSGTSAGTCTTVRGIAYIPTHLKKKHYSNKASKHALFFSLHTQLTDQTGKRTGSLLGLRSYCLHEGFCPTHTHLHFTCLVMS